MRVALGNMDDDGLGIMFGRRTRLAPLPTGPDGLPIKGRAYVAMAGQQPVEMQAFWTPEIPVQPAPVASAPVVRTQPIPVQQAREPWLDRLARRVARSLA
jgi:hypothetical protein